VLETHVPFTLAAFPNMESSFFFTDRCRATL
jgi:hypothetical protein